MKKVLITALLATLAITCKADKVINVSDGDTITVLKDNKPVKIRFANIDAPEKDQPFGQASKKSLHEICYGKDAKYDASKTEKFGRILATVTCDGVNANRRQVELGFAWVYTKYNSDTSLPSLEKAAKQAKLGLWADPDPLEPWKFRHAPKPKGECKVGGRGGKYMMVNGKKRYDLC